MRISAELRWFWSGACPDQVRTWFHGGPFPAGGGEAHPRVDRYFVQGGESEVGLKLRAAKGPTPQAEFKGLVALQPSAEPLAGAPAVQIWCKWNVIAPAGGETLDVAKVRWLRKFRVEGGAASEVALDAEERPLKGGLPDVGCNLELTRIQALGRAWETIGFEAFGDLTSAPAALQACLRALRPLPAFDGLVQSYPEWLAALAGAGPG
jgi:hypothetical protein